MKCSKIFRISAMAAVLALLVAAIPATSAMAQTATAIANTSLSGTTVEVSGTGFTASATVSIYFPDTGTLKTNASTGITGYFYAAFSIGEYPAGSKTLWVKDGVSWYPISFSITPVIGLSSNSGHVDDQITVTGVGFAADKDVTITFADEEVGTATTSSQGSFTNATFTVPDSYRGSHTVKALDDSSYYDTAIFTTQQSMSIVPTSGSVGSDITVSGTGFRADRTVTITFNDSTMTTNPTPVRTNDNGTFSNTTFTIPTSINGTYEVEVSDGYYEDSTNFAVVAGVTISPTTSYSSPGYVGDEVTVNGSGFLVNHLVTITYLSTPVTVATTTTTASGTFSATFEVPVSESGNHTITASDGTNTITSTFVIESTAPPIPEPLLPLMDTKAGSRAQFDWEDVTDPSLPVTYTLQIATDELFTTESILVEKTDLAGSEYTLTDEEKLASVERESPYYWRVKATDSASNDSDWTGAGSFYVGFIFHMPTWAIYTLFSVGALGLGVLGFWLGRRSAYS